MSISYRAPFAPLRTALVAAAGLSLAATGFAAPPSAPPGAAPPSGAVITEPAPAKGKITDEKLKQFAAAAADVQKIQEEYAARAQMLEKEAEQKIVSSVRGAGMSVTEFAALVRRVQTDPRLAERLDNMKSL